jgi:hypothetical protein
VVDALDTIDSITPMTDYITPMTDSITPMTDLNYSESLKTQIFVGGCVTIIFIIYALHQNVSP